MADSDHDILVELVAMVKALDARITILDQRLNGVVPDRCIEHDVQVRAIEQTLLRHESSLNQMWAKLWVIASMGSVFGSMTGAVIGYFIKG